MTRLLLHSLAVLAGIQSFCSRCGAGPYGESAMAAHMASAHGVNY